MIEVLNYNMQLLKFPITLSLTASMYRQLGCFLCPNVLQLCVKEEFVKKNYTVSDKWCVIQCHGSRHNNNTTSGEPTIITTQFGKQVLHICACVRIYFFTSFDWILYKGITHPIIYLTIKGACSGSHFNCLFPLFMQRRSRMQVLERCEWFL